MTSPLIILALVSFLLHLVWEALHIRFYTGYEKMKERLPVFVQASLGDVLYTFLAIVLIAFFEGSLTWFLAADASDFLGLALLGFYIAVFVEYKAAALKRWEYTGAMPRFLGLGLSPLLQMTVLLPLSVYITVALINWL
ncbi:hypothetical protein A3A38_03575 [Candidatus Kaiserbacteria bacterium RIFCSPLOWO2_01_FULL_53_17]|uniref:Uncharacterized protein n=1 Tax=Candidatus Kaiserbacteria bacterium RIFCSPLOWO2_01_FULL_53_17 TaxID=1798511 RepID=A0A1F6EGM1_9BACT|nr:MAG: hypothetical protein A3A38_03575 [Candidatus Kaiserbacteria bacterium RIFCSPLOWO2_01_FULL_53_17]